MKFKHGDGCFCRDCMLVDTLNELRKKAVEVEKQLRALRQTRPTPADMAKEIVAYLSSE